MAVYELILFGVPVGTVSRALQAMAIGIPGVFAVLGVFYIALKIMMIPVKNQDDNQSDEEQ